MLLHNREKKPSKSSLVHNVKTNPIITKGLAVTLMLLSSLCAFSQTIKSFALPDSVDEKGLSVTIPRPSIHSTMIGMGHANVLDTYLAPYNYTGTDFRLQLESLRTTSSGNLRQSQLDVNGALLENRVGTTKAYAAGTRYSMTWYYVNDLNSDLRIAYGPEASAYLGATYINRSGNNPANAHANIMLNLAGMANYDFSLWGKEMKLTYQMTIPFLGVAFSPNYGQSYYEAFVLWNLDHNILFANPFNMPSLRHRLMLDIPVGQRGSTVRIGYVGHFNQSTFNNLKYHSYTHDFMIGYTKTFLR